MTDQSESHITTVYKVVQISPQRDVYLSYMALELPEKWIAVYSVGVWTEPPVEGSKLFAFTDERTAFSWATDVDIAVFRAEATGVEPIHTASRFCQSGEDLQRYWKDWRTEYILLTTLPRSSVTCDKIRLVNMVWEER